MTRVVALLRGVNVGGKNTLPMATLRTIAASIGLEDCSTYIQSGNLVATLDHDATPLSLLGSRFGAAIHDELGITTPVIIRTSAEIQSAATSNPFLARGLEEATQHVIFAAEPSLLPDLSSYEPEQAVASGSDIFVHLPNGVAMNKLATLLQRSVVPEGTMRNWRTVLKLTEMVTGTEA